MCYYHNTHTYTHQWGAEFFWSDKPVMVYGRGLWDQRYCSRCLFIHFWPISYNGNITLLACFFFFIKLFLLFFSNGWLDILIHKYFFFLHFFIKSHHLFYLYFSPVCICIFIYFYLCFKLNHCHNVRLILCYIFLKNYIKIPVALIMLNLISS